MTTIIAAGYPMHAVSDPAKDAPWKAALVVAWEIRTGGRPRPITAEHGPVDPSAVVDYCATLAEAEALWDSERDAAEAGAGWVPSDDRSVFEGLRAGDVMRGYDGQAWLVDSIGRDRAGQIKAVLTRGRNVVTGYPPSGTPVTVLADSGSDEAARLLDEPAADR